MGADALLREMQGLLAGLYDVPVAHDVAQFLITDAADAARLQGAAGAPPTDEQLLIAEGEEGVEVGLYVDAAVLGRLAVRCPMSALDEGNLADFCTALEGVSHFHYFTWSAGYARPVSLLELELQAEVDKYASALRLMLGQRDGRFPVDLFHRLFEHAGLLPHLGEEERSRYRQAHRFAARFCRRLEERYLRRRLARPAALLAELRAFYRLGSRAKVHHAAQWH
ncbi:MAG TPA: hypothetical protein VMT50_03905 [Steroidobacteraceae bacterium]|nr:hypothetical protein [Steroidobacteraceae bacterium]